jgi:putative protein-disulfide isomerase
MDQTKTISEDSIAGKPTPVEITYYTDPLCCWSWALESEITKLQHVYSTKIIWRYCMTGMLPDWNNYFDQINNITRPIQMGPLWMYAQYVTDVKMNSAIWKNDPPTSSYPACIAVKAAFLQSFEIGQSYLKLLRKSVMTDEQNIAKENILIDNAERISKTFSGLNLQRFKSDLKNGKALEAFRADMQEIARRGIKKFPALLIKNKENNQGLIAVGYRKYEQFKKIISTIENGDKASADNFEMNYFKE